METLQVTQIQRADTLEALNRSEIDIQIATAKRYPRSVKESTERILSLATQDEETAQECFYALRRNGNAGSSLIEGPSVRLAEIVAAAWGNLRVQSQIVCNDGKFITARGVCHDLETNTAVSFEVQRRITDKNGRTFSDDMIVTTGNAAGAIAFRNAVFKVVPKATISTVLKAIKDVSMGKTIDIEATRQKMIQYFAKAGVTTEMILSYLEVQSIEDIDAEMIEVLRGTSTAIKEGTTTAKECFIDPYNQKVKSQKAVATVSSTKDKVAAALAKQNDDMPELL